MVASAGSASWASRARTTESRPPENSTATSERPAQRRFTDAARAAPRASAASAGPASRHAAGPAASQHYRRRTGATPRSLPRSAHLRGDFRPARASAAGRRRRDLSSAHHEAPPAEGVAAVEQRPRRRAVVASAVGARTRVRARASCGARRGGWRIGGVRRRLPRARPARPARRRRPSAADCPNHSPFQQRALPRSPVAECRRPLDRIVKTLAARATRGAGTQASRLSGLFVRCRSGRLI